MPLNSRLIRSTDASVDDAVHLNVNGSNDTASSPDCAKAVISDQKEVSLMAIDTDGNKLYTVPVAKELKDSSSEVDNGDDSISSNVDVDLNKETTDRIPLTRFLSTTKNITILKQLHAEIVGDIEEQAFILKPKSTFRRPIKITEGEFVNRW